MKQLFRARQNRVFFGVCGGVAERYGWDPTLVRLAFIAATLLGGPGIVAYFIMAVVMPRSRSLGSWDPGALPSPR